MGLATRRSLDGHPDHRREVEAVMKTRIRRLVYSLGSVVALIIGIGAGWKP